MTVLAYHHVDAFADRPFTGNQAAVMPLDAWLPDATLQAIAAENNFAETAFVVPRTDDVADYDLRWFTPTCEVALCGHATLASGHILIGARARVTFATRQAGVLLVERDGDGLMLGLPAWVPTPAPVPDWAARELGTPPAHYAYREGRYHVLHFPDAATVRALSPDLTALGARGDDQYICTAPGVGDPSGADVVSRVFVPGGGVDEDSVTGSAHAVLTPYWVQLLGRDRFTAYQASRRGGHVACRLAGDRALLGGCCVTVVEGRFTL